MSLNIKIKSIQPTSILQPILIDLVALGFILLMPAAAHLTGIPFYFLEPMRIMLVAALLFSNRANAYLIAAVLPVFSFLVSGHPAPVKMTIIIAELLFNVWLFQTLIRRTKKPFLSMFSAIVLSKLFCYLAYWVIFSWSFVVAESQPIFLVAQLAITLVLSVWMAVVTTKRQTNRKF